jgi:hypothetical protein
VLSGDWTEVMNPSFCLGCLPISNRGPHIRAMPGRRRINAEFESHHSCGYAGNEQLTLICRCETRDLREAVRG